MRNMFASTARFANAHSVFFGSALGAVVAFSLIGAAVWGTAGAVLPAVACGVVFLIAVAGGIAMGVREDRARRAEFAATIAGIQASAHGIHEVAEQVRRSSARMVS